MAACQATEFRLASKSDSLSFTQPQSICLPIKATCISPANELLRTR